MKRIIFTDSFSSERETFVAHRSYELEDELADKMIKAKVARPDKSVPATEDPHAPKK